MEWYVSTREVVLMSTPLASPHSVNSSTLAQPIPLDATGDMTTDLLAFSSTTKKLELWQNSWSDSNYTEIFQS